MVSPTSPLPRPPCIDPGARTMTASGAATLSMPVDFDCARGSGFVRTRAKLTDKTLATQSSVAGLKLTAPTPRREPRPVGLAFGDVDVIGENVLAAEDSVQGNNHRHALPRWCRRRSAPILQRWSCGRLSQRIPTPWPECRFGPGSRHIGGLSRRNTSTV